MTDVVWKWIKQENLIQAGDLVLAGVSGGADSVCLLRLLLEGQKKLDFTLEVVHVEHGIRGAESREDARFVEELCEAWNVPCHTYHVDVPGYAAVHGMGLEEAARTLRYECYRTEARAALRCAGSVPETGAPVGRNVKIALAHHADDNAETILFHLARGSGIKGLCGMRAAREVEPGITVIRPLLGMSRSRIEQYLMERGQSFRQDGTNLDVDYSRNRIRHKVLPELAQVNSQAAAHITRSAGMLAELYDYLAGEVAAILPEICIAEAEQEKPGAPQTVQEKPAAGLNGAGAAEGIIIRHELFEHYPAVLQKAAVHRILECAAGSSRDIGSAHVEAVVHLAGLQPGRSLSLPYQLGAERVYEGIRIRRAAESGGEVQEEYLITPELLRLAESGNGVTISLPDGELQLRVREICGEIWKIRKKTYTKWLNYDKIKGSLRLRKRAGGDYLVIDGMGHRKKLKEYFIEEKVPREWRDHIWLLTEDSHVIWVVGGRISADCKVEQDTKKILEVQMSGGNYRED